MLEGLDHIVILVGDLGRAIRHYEGLGFEVTPGGEHADGLTHNALIPLKDGSYLELVAFVDPEDTRDNVWGGRPFLSSGGGLIDYCATSGDLQAEARRLEGLSFTVEGPHQGGRLLPDGGEIRWRIARVRQDGRLLPFLIEDITPRSLRVPAGPSAEHPNGATSISSLEIAAPDAAGAARSLAALIGTRGETLQLGACTLRPVVREGSEAASRRLDAAGPGPLALGLAAGAAVDEELDLRLSHGVGIRLLRRDRPG